MKKKKVKNCTISELEKWFIKKYGYIPNHTDVYWYDVRFISFEKGSTNEVVIDYLLKDNEIEVEE